MLDTLTLPYSGKKQEGNCLNASVALELALGASLPDLIEDWPTGIVCEWNKANRCGVFDATRSFGEAATAFLSFRIAQLKFTPDVH